MVSHTAGFAGKGDGSGSQDHFTSQLLTECLCWHGTDGIIADGAGSVLNLIPADKGKPGASLILQSDACFWPDLDTQRREPENL